MAYLRYVCNEPQISFSGHTNVIPRIGESICWKDDVGGEARFYRVKDVNYGVSRQKEAPDHLSHVITVQLEFWFRSPAGQQTPECSS